MIDWTPADLDRSPRLPESRRLGVELATALVGCDSPPVALLVDGDHRRFERYAAWLAPRYDVVVVGSGSDVGRHSMDGADVALVELGDRPSERSGVVMELGARHLGTRVGLLLSASPVYDPAELGVDLHRVGRVPRADLLGVVDDLLVLTEYDDLVEELYDLTRRRVALGEGLTESERYRRLDTEIESLNEVVEACLARLSETAFFAAVRDCPSGLRE